MYYRISLSIHTFAESILKLMYYMRKQLFSFLFLCLALTGYASPGIKGTVIDQTTRDVLEFAHVVLYSGDRVIKEAMSGTDGTFQIEPIQPGDYSIRVHLLGYDVYLGNTFTVSNGMKNLGAIPMRVLEVGLKEIEVVANKKQVIYKLDKRVIEASSNLLSSGGTAVDILENTPSIRVNAEGEVTFRGSSGFAVYVNGKPSVFSGTQALEQIPSGQIQNIEIITTPSAQHDTGGDVGIINIITKKHFQDGLSGVINLSGNTVWSRTVDFLLTQQNANSRWYVGGYAGNRLRKSHFSQEKTTLVNDTTTTSYSNGPRKSNGYAYTMNGGWSYTAKRTSYSVDLEGGYAGHKRNGDLDYTENRSTKGEAFEEGTFRSADDYDIHETFGQGTISANHSFNNKGHNLSGSFYLKHGGDALEYFQSDLFDLNNVRQQGHRAWEEEHRWTVRANADYVWPYSKTGQVKAGYQYFSYSEDGDYKMQFWNPQSQEFYWRDDIYNTFYFKQGINSLYAIIGDSYRAFDFQVGLRGEHTRQELRSSREWANRLYRRFEFFPSAHIGYNLTKNQKLQFAYSRRTTRPELYFMEPYITYRDYYTAEIGNPDIRPEYIHSFELNYSLTSGDNMLSASLFHRSRTDKIERLRIPYVAGVTLDSMANVGHDYSTGLELTGNLQATRWWNTQVNGSLYHYKIENEYKADGADETSTNYEIAWNNAFTLGKFTRVQLDGNFVGPSVTTQGRTQSFWFVNLAVRQQFFNRRLTATLSFRDVFNTARYVSTITTSNLVSKTRIRPDYPLIGLTLSYTFNQFKIKSGLSNSSKDLFEGTNH